MRHVDGGLGRTWENVRKAVKTKASRRLRLWTGGHPVSDGFWTSLAEPVDRMCGERHESNQPPNRLYKET